MGSPPASPRWSINSNQLDWNGLLGHPQSQQLADLLITRLHPCEVGFTWIFNEQVYNGRSLFHARCSGKDVLLCGALCIVLEARFRFPNGNQIGVVMGTHGCLAFLVNKTVLGITSSHFTWDREHPLSLLLWLKHKNDAWSVLTFCTC